MFIYISIFYLSENNLFAETHVWYCTNSSLNIILNQPGCFGFTNTSSKFEQTQEFNCDKMKYGIVYFKFHK